MVLLKKQIYLIFDQLLYFKKVPKFLLVTFTLAEWAVYYLPGARVLIPAELKLLGGGVIVQ